MATVSAHIDAAPAAVYAVLANGWNYSGWVVGTSHMQAVEPNWPAAGSRLFHATGIWPLALNDETRVEEATPDKRLVMTARGRPLGEARVEITLDPEGTGSRVTLTETPIKGPGAVLNGRILDAIFRRRNTECLARLAAMSEHRPAPPSPDVHASA